MKVPPHRRKGRGSILGTIFKGFTDKIKPTWAKSNKVRRKAALKKTLKEVEHKLVKFGEVTYKKESKLQAAAKKKAMKNVVNLARKLEAEEHEAQELVEKMKSEVKHFVETHGDAHELLAELEREKAAELEKAKAIIKKHHLTSRED